MPQTIQAVVKIRPGEAQCSHYRIRIRRQNGTIYRIRADLGSLKMEEDQEEYSRRERRRERALHFIERRLNSGVAIADLEGMEIPD